MRSQYLSDQKREVAFIEKAAEWFKNHPEGTSYAENDPEPGEYLALRWGPDKDCIVLVKLDDYFEPRLYHSVIKI